MNINEKILNFIDILNDLDKISKKLYLESPEVWIDFSDKVGEQNLDEMVLFYATKYNYVSVLKYVVDNNVINLDLPSKNKNYASIREHLLSIAKDCKSYDAYNYLSKGEYNSPKNSSKDNDKESSSKESVEINKNNDAKNDYFPVFLCPHCNANILKSGYKVYEEINFGFSQDKNKSTELSRKRDDRVFCSKCNSNINNVTIELLENICSIHNCKKCGKDLTQIGINEKINMKFNDEDNKFISKEKTYNCPSCDEKLNESQIKYFNL